MRGFRGKYAWAIAALFVFTAINYITPLIASATIDFALSQKPNESPLTTRIKGYPFEVAIAGKPDSVVLADQVKSLDWRARRATRKGRVSPAELEEVRAKLRALVG
jgi:mRNA-degrading endonuclease toxin of MazEF toxin-antitoxin module